MDRGNLFSAGSFNLSLRGMAGAAPLRTENPRLWAASLGGKLVCLARKNRVAISPRQVAVPPEPDTRQLILDLQSEMRTLLTPALAPEVVHKTLSVIAADFLPRKRTTLEDSGTFEGRINNHLLPALGDFTAATLKPMHIQDLMRALVVSGLSEQTANHVRDGGRQLVEFAIDNGEWPFANPFSRVAPLDLPEKDYETLTRKEAAMLLRFIDARWRPLFALALYLGPRRGTIFALRVEDVDLAGGLIHFKKTKTGKKILGVPIPNELHPYLVEAVARAREGRVFTSRSGCVLTRDNKTLGRVLSQAMERAGIVRNITFHGLRRVSSSLHQEALVHPWIVSRILGHSQASLARFGNPVENMTSRYTVFSPEFVREQLNRLSLTVP